MQLVAMLAIKWLAGVASELNLRNTFQTYMQVRDPPSLWKPGQTSQEVQNRGVSGLTQEFCPSKKILKKLTDNSSYSTFYYLSDIQVQSKQSTHYNIVLTISQLSLKMLNNAFV